MESIGDAWGFSGKTPIIPSRGFSIVMECLGPNILFFFYLFFF